MHVQILKQEDVLIASIHDALTDADLLSMRDRVVEEVTRHRSRGVIVNVAGLDVMDSFAVHTLSATALMITLRGAETVIVGIKPDVAVAMVQLGLTLKGIHTALDLDAGLEYLNSRQPRERKYAG